MPLEVFGEVDIELGQQVVFVGPNNSGKTSALQALALWSKCLSKWIEKRGESNSPKEKPGVTINRRDLMALPVPSANLLWRDLHVREGSRENGRTRTRNVLIDIDVEGMNEGKMWRLALELDYANEEAFYCRPKLDEQGGRMEIPAAARSIQVAYLPPMSGLAANEAAARDLVIAFVGSPHRIDNRVNQLYKALKEIGFEQYLQAEQAGWVLYLEGATDLAVLQALAKKLDHPASKFLEAPFVHYVANQPSKAENHFHGLREAKPDLVGIAIYDRLERVLHSGDRLSQMAWRQREIENYFTSREVLLAFAKDLGHRQLGELNVQPMVNAMAAAIDSITSALQVLGRPDVFGPDIQVTDDFLDPLFSLFFRSLNLPEGTMRKTDYHRLAEFVNPASISREITEKLNKIVSVAEMAKPRITANGT